MCDAMSTDLRSELHDFQAFVSDRLSEDGPVPSLEECLRLWCERSETLESIEQGLAEAEAGLGVPYREFLDEFRLKRRPSDSK